MALLGTENSIRCNKCGCIEFEEKTVVKFSEAMTIDKLKASQSIGGTGAYRDLKHRYFCIKCGEEVK